MVKSSNPMVRKNTMGNKSLHDRQKLEQLNNNLFFNKGASAYEQIQPSKMIAYGSIGPIYLMLGHFGE